MEFLPLMLVNKPVKFESKAKHKYFFVIFFLKKKDRYLLYYKFTFNSKNSQIIYIVKSLRKRKRKARNPQINSKGSIIF
jgi:hypothetical protein